MPAKRTRPPRRSKSRKVTDQYVHVNTSVDAFRRILRELRVAARRTELATGLSAAQAFVLSAVAASPGRSVNEIARSTTTDRSSVASIVERLARYGYVTREQSGEDRRRASIMITPRGRRATDRSAPAPMSLLVAGLEKLSAVQLNGLARGLVALTRAMGIADERPRLLFAESAPPQRARRSGARR